MTRLRYNGLRTTLGASLTGAATAVTFAAALTHANGTAVPTIASPDFIPLTILDSNGYLSEIVYLTAYATGATTGTIARGREGTTGTSHASADKLVQGPTTQDTLSLPVDDRPAVPSAYDDEFDGSSTATWSATTTAPATVNAVQGGFLHLAANTALASKYVGRVQTAPTTYPYTITTKVVDNNSQTNYQRGGGILLQPTSGLLTYVGVAWDSGTAVQWIKANYLSGVYDSRGAYYLPNHRGSFYLRVTVNSATSVSADVSANGLAWANIMTNLAVTAFTQIGLAVDNESAAPTVDGFFDFFRVT